MCSSRSRAAGRCRELHATPGGRQLTHHRFLGRLGPLQPPPPQPWQSCASAPHELVVALQQLVAVETSLSCVGVQSPALWWGQPHHKPTATSCRSIAWCFEVTRDTSNLWVTCPVVGPTTPYAHRRAAIAKLVALVS